MTEPTLSELQALAHEAEKLTLDLIRNHPEIPSKIWASTMISLTAKGFFHGGHSYALFKHEMRKAIDYYKSMW